MAQTLVKLYAHLVFSTKGRAGWIVPEVEAGLHKYMTGIVKGCEGRLVRVGGMPDHVHLLVLLPKVMALADFMRVLKKESSAWMKGQGHREFYWQEGYAGFSVGGSGVKKCIGYINDQKKHHRKSTFKEELVLMLEKHGMEYEDRYLWE